MRRKLITTSLCKKTCGSAEVCSEFPETPTFLDATFNGIVAEAIEWVKLVAGHAFVVAGLSEGRKLHDKNGDCSHQEDVNHAALMKKNVQHKPNQKQSRRYKPEFHVFPFR
jgi:hypothetical protein